MVTGRDDFVIAIRSALLRKGAQQRFSLLGLLLFSILILILGSLNFKLINITKSIIKDVIYRASFIASVPENIIKNSYINVSDHFNHYYKYDKMKTELEILKSKDLSKQIIEFENIKLKKVIDDYFLKSNETYAKVLIDKDSPFLKSIILNKGSKNGIKRGMIVLDDIYLIGKVVEVNYLTSRVLLVSDINSKVPVTIEPIGAQAIMSGSGDEDGVLQYTNVENIKNNDEEFLVVTSGAGSVFNSGIPIGKINKKVDTNNDNELSINFYKDFTQLNYVKVVSNKKISMDQPSKEEFALDSQQLATINKQKQKFEVLKQQKEIVDEIRAKIERENTDLKQKIFISEDKIKKLENLKSQTKISEDELAFLRLNLLYSNKCRKSFYNKLFKIGTAEYKACIMSKGKKN
jgi:rod shape-determining protein MreC